VGKREVGAGRSDPDGHAVDFRLEGAPGFVTLDPHARRIALAPGYGDAGSYLDVQVVATDRGTPPLSITQPLVIQVSNTNRNPTVSVVEVSPVGSERCAPGQTGLTCSLSEGDAFTLSVLVSDDPEDTIASLEVSPRPVGSALVVAPDHKSATFTWQTNFQQGGTALTVLVFTTADNNGGTGTVAAPVTVNDVNRPPIVQLAEAQTTSPRCGTVLPLQCVIPELQTVTLNLTASDDPDEEIQSLSMTPPPDGSWVAFTPAGDNRSATVVVSPGHNDAWELPRELAFHATDSKGFITTVRALITVVNVNRVPALAVAEQVPLGGTACCSGGTGTPQDPIRCTIPEDYPLAFALTAADPDGDPLTLLTMAAPTAAGAAFSPNVTNTQATFTWRPSYAQAATQPYPITFSVQDALGGSVQKAVTVTVTDVNRPPSLTLASGTVGGTDACRKENGTWHCYVDGGDSAPPLVGWVKAEDFDGDAVNLAIAASDLPALSVCFDPAAGLFIFVPPGMAAQDFHVTFEARDVVPNPAPSTLDLAIHLNPVDVAPTLTLHECTTRIRENDTLSCTARISDPDPRDAPLTIGLDGAPTGFFTYDAATRTGAVSWILLPGERGLFQFDFVGTDRRNNRVVVPWVVSVTPREEVLRPRRVLIAGSRPVDMAFRAPYLYVVDDGGFVSVYNTSDAGTAPVHVAVAPAAKRIKVSGDRLYAAGAELTIWDLAGTKAAAPELLQAYQLRPTPPNDLVVHETGWEPASSSCTAVGTRSNGCCGSTSAPASRGSPARSGS
jgi:hypothetical protein